MDCSGRTCWFERNERNERNERLFLLATQFGLEKSQSFSWYIKLDSGKVSLSTLCVPLLTHHVCIVTGRTQKQTPWHSSEHSSAKSKKPCDIRGSDKGRHV